MKNNMILLGHADVAAVNGSKGSVSGTIKSDGGKVSAEITFTWTF